LIDEFLKSKTKYSIYFNQNIDKPPKLPSLLSIPYISSFIYIFKRCS